MTKVSIDTIIRDRLKRPSHKELTGKIRQARRAVSKGEINIVEPASISADALDLDYLVDDLPDVLSEILEEIKPDDYTGKKPPERSYEDKIKDTELFAFKWASKRFGCELYLKFTLKDGVLWLVSFHLHREIKGEENGKKAD